ncbi:MAG: ComF family protein [Patescibacteria group bacterium]
MVTSSFLDQLLGFVYPTSCVSCKVRGKLLCGECAAKLRPLSSFTCLVCEKPALGGFTHSLCSGRFTPERTLSAFSYRGPARPLVKALKYKSLKRVAEVMAHLTLEDLAEKGIFFGKKAWVVPIPLSFWRQNERGFNQAEIFAQALARELKLKINPKLLKRVRNTPSQVSLSRGERSQNIQGAFAGTRRIRKKDILLVDDVLTTGATVREAAKALKKKGANQVWVLTFARD